MQQNRVAFRALLVCVVVVPFQSSDIAEKEIELCIVGRNMLALVDSNFSEHLVKKRPACCAQESGFGAKQYWAFVDTSVRRVLHSLYFRWTGSG